MPTNAGPTLALAVLCLLAAGCTTTTAPPLPAWDSDADGVVTRQEFRAGFAQSRLYRPGNRGDWIDEEEVMDGTFDSFDEDGDLRLDRDEFWRFERDAGVEGIYR